MAAVLAPNVTGVNMTVGLVKDAREAVVNETRWQNVVLSIPIAALTKDATWVTADSFYFK